MPAVGGVLVVDLDDTLVQTDLLLESALAALKYSPLRAIGALAALRHGRAAFKAKLAELADLRADLLPYNADVVDLVRERRARGDTTVLATGANQRYADAVATHLRLFDSVHGSSDTLNLSGAVKAERLVERYGEGGFEYVADAAKDLPVWLYAREAIAVGASPSTLSALAAAGVPCTVLTTRRGGATALLNAMRPRHWLKNSLVFLPLFAAHLFNDWAAVLACLLAFVAFSLAASAGYLINDLLDLQSDRLHPVKRGRPMASGALPLRTGLLAVPALIAAALVPALFLHPGLAAVLVVYLATTIAYSLVLKRRPTLDVLTLAGLYTLRVIGGAIAIGVAPSFWLLAFSMFLFLSLAYVKRYVELDSCTRAGQGQPSGRGYLPDDLPLLQSLGISAGYGAVLVLALYINSPEIEQLYTTPDLVWLVCPILLFWVVRIWTIAHRGLMQDDPLVFALEDRVSLACILVAALVVVLAF